MEGQIKRGRQPLTSLMINDSLQRDSFEKDEIDTTTQHHTLQKNAKCEAMDDQ
jgi:hypothetical protein